MLHTSTQPDSLLSGAFVRGLEPEPITIPNYNEALASYGLGPEEAHREPVVVAAGTSLVLNGTGMSPLRRRHLQSPDLDQFKTWIGVPDSEVRCGRAVPPPVAPSNPWSKRLEGRADGLSSADWEDLKAATAHYLFGNASAYGHYRSAIEGHLAPFEAALYAGESLVIEEGASLVVTGYPAVLLFRSVELHGGFMKLCSTTRMLVERMLVNHLHDTH